MLPSFASLWRRISLIIGLFCLLSAPADACTSVIISAKTTTTGRPLMLKHRDTDDQQNSVRFFRGAKYDFIGLVNSDSPELGEVWTGTNSAGFAIMNTAAYNFREDDTPTVQMDREGEVMYLALSVCATVRDFERLLDTLPAPWGVEANFGVIDAYGGAAYYEVNNYRWVKYDVNDFPCGYRVVTNFCEAGRREDYKGWDRYCIASDVMRDEFQPGIDHRFLFERLSRNTTQRNGHSIPRDITSASIVIEGVKPGSDPLATVMWTILGNPLTHIAYPLTVQDCLRAKSKAPRTIATMQKSGLNRQKEERIRQRFVRTNTPCGRSKQHK